MNPLAGIRVKIPIKQEIYKHTHTHTHAHTHTQTILSKAIF